MERHIHGCTPPAATGKSGSTQKRRARRDRREAERFNAELSVKARAVRDLDYHPSNGRMLVRLCCRGPRESQELLERRLLASKRQELVTLQIRSLVGASAGIAGVARVTLTEPSPSFSSWDFGEHARSCTSATAAFQSSAASSGTPASRQSEAFLISERN